MASVAQKSDATYMLYGFGNDLDWRQTCFLEPLPPSRYCTYCGRVCASMMMLPCCHIVCAGCYSQCLTGNYSCALDALSFRQQDVAAMPFTIPDLAARHIRCWNAERGCAVSGPAFLILEHFHKDCLYHSVSCSRCNQEVAHADLVDHLASGCSVENSPQLLLFQNKQGALLGSEGTIEQLEGPAASRHLNSDGQDLLLIHDQPETVARGDVAPSLTSFALAGHCLPTIVHSSGDAAKGSNILSGLYGKQPPAVGSYSPAAVVSYLHGQLPAAVHTELFEIPSYVDRHNDLLTGRNVDSFSSGAEVTDSLLCLSPTEMPSPGIAQESSLQGREPLDSYHESPKTAPPGSSQFPPVAAVLTSGTLSMPQANSSRGETPGTEAPNTTAERVDHTSSRTEAETASTTQDTGKSDKTEERNSSQDQAILSPALPLDKGESGSTPEGGTRGSGFEAEALVLVSEAEVSSASSNANGETLSALLYGYLNHIGRLVRMIVAGIDIVRDALGKLMPEELVFALKACEEVRAHLNEENATSSDMTEQIKTGTTQVLQAFEKQSPTMVTEETLSREYVAEKIDNLVSLGKHVLGQRIHVSVPVQWYLEGWSELKARALSVGEAADYFHDIATKFFGYVIVPGLMLENTGGTLRLRFTFYVRRGIYDNFLEWPLDKKLTLTILHHTDKGKSRVLTVDTKRDLKEKCIQPGTEITKASLSTKNVKADYFDMNGYVTGDKLLLKFEVK